MQLNDSQKSRIRAEEIFRQEVVLSFDKRSGFVHFLNTPLGLWLLSSVFLAGLLAIAGATTAHYDLKAKQQEMRERISQEICAHCGEFSGAADICFNYTDYAIAYRDHLNWFLRLHFSDFKDATMDQLVWELGRLPHKSDKKTSTLVSGRIEQIWNRIAKLKERDTTNWNLTATEKKKFDSGLFRLLNNPTKPFGIMQLVRTNETATK